MGNPISKHLISLLSFSQLSLVLRWLVQIRRPQWLVQWLIHKIFIEGYGVNVNEAEKPITEYTSPVEFFTRRLKTGLRPLEGKSHHLISPVDGRVGSCGIISEGQLYQIKGKPYSLEELLPGCETRDYEGGEYATLYLSPRDYHRVHHGLTARLIKLTYLPGRLIPVNDHSLRVFQSVYSKNRRLVFLYQSGAVMVMVGALNVGKMTVNAFPGFPNWVFFKKQERTCSLAVERGDEAGIFHLGSTVVLLFTRGQAKLMVKEGNSVRMGQMIGELLQ